MRSAPAKSQSPVDNRIPFLEGRPERDAAIGKDDLLNLRIALGLHVDVSELYADPHLFVFRR